MLLLMLLLLMLLLLQGHVVWVLRVSFAVTVRLVTSGTQGVHVVIVGFVTQTLETKFARLAWLRSTQT